MRWLPFLLPLGLAAVLVAVHHNLAESGLAIAICGGLTVAGAALAVVGWRAAHAGPRRPFMFALCWILGAAACARFASQIAWLGAHATIEGGAIEVWLNGVVGLLFALSGINFAREVADD